MAFFNNANTNSSNNPVLKRMSNYNDLTSDSNATYKGIAMKTCYFLALIVLGVIAFFYMHNYFAHAGYTAFQISEDVYLYGNEMVIYVALGIVTLIAGFVAAFAPKTVPVAGSIYSAGMGYTVTFISFTYAAQYKGIVVEALFLTVLLIGVLLFLYSKGIVKVNSKFRTILYSALMVSVIASVIYFLLHLIIPNSGLVRALTAIQYGPLGIVFAFLGVLIGAFLIIDDFESIKNTVEYGFSEKYEWTASYGLIISMIYLYLRILQLLARIANNKNN